MFGYPELSMANELVQVIRAWIADAPSPGPTADLVTIRSGLLRADDADLEVILKEFFDVEPIVIEVNDVIAERSKPIAEGLRRRLVEALLFHGLDDAASPYLQ
jgi:hypothetical protein